ncbi:MAG: SPOR domain-containing protein [Bdellovibrionales bacterium]|nr:SPOR domain-containing protein [Bdellovibrionales bacterium]
MSRKKLQGYELRFGIVQLVMVLGIVTGSMVCAFYFGYQSGRDSGYETASADSLSRSVRLPISDEELQQEVSEEQASQVYAKLGDDRLTTQIGEEPGNPDVDTAQLDPIPSLDTAPIIVERKKTENTDTADTSLLDEPVKSVSEEKESDLGGAIRVLGDTPATRSKGTLGGLLELKNEKSSPDVILKAKTSEESSAQLETRNASGEQAGAIQIESPNKEIKREAEPDKQDEGEKPSQQFAKLQKSPINQDSLKEEAPAASSIEAVKSSPPAAVSSTPRSGWYVQVAAPKARSDADSLAQKLRSSGFQITIETANVRGEKYFRVLVGPEDNRTLAQRLSGQVKREPYVQGEPFIKVIR